MGGCAAAISERLEFDGGAARKMEELVDEKEDNEAEELDNWHATCLSTTACIVPPVR
jgi:hypothetical protein